MNCLRIKLPYKTLLLIFICIIYALFITKYEPVSYYSSNTKTIEGIVIQIVKKEDYYQITIRGKEKILGYYSGDLDFKCGMKVKLEGDINLPSNNTNFNTFNYRNFLKSMKIYHTMNIKKITVIDHNTSYFYKIKNIIYERIEKIKLSKKYLKIFILGENELDEDIKDSYLKNGISHLLSISGMHVTFLAFIILSFLKLFSDNSKFNYCLTIIFLIFYAFLTGFKPSVIRACFLFFIIDKSKSLDYLLLLGSFLLLINPYYIYNIGFKFSFIISFYLMLSSKHTINKKYLTKILITSSIAFLASLPILINEFYYINLLTPLINVIFIPFVSLILFPFTLLTFIFPNLDFICFLLTKVFEKCSLFVSSINLNIVFPKISFISIIYYIFITLTLCNLKHIKFLVLLLIIHALIPFLDNSYKITTLDVKQGDSTLIKYPLNKTNILIDTGGIVGSRSSLTKNITSSYLHSLGINRIDYLILTHGDYDHMGEAVNLVNNFKVEKVIFNCGPYNELEQELIKVLNKKKIKYYTCIKELNIDKNKLYFLQTKEYDDENDNSNVIYTELNGYKFMFMGDASITTEKEVLDKYNLPNIDALKVGHHGSKTSSSEDFINEINPKYSIISVGKNNRYGHPNKEVLDNLSDSKIYRTDHDGSILFKIKNNKLKVETCSP